MDFMSFIFGVAFTISCEFVALITLVLIRRSKK